MAETHQAELLGKPGEMITITDPEPRASARLFKFVSDQIWEQKPDDWPMSMLRIPSVLSAPTALEAINEVVGSIDEKLLIANIDKDLELSGGRNEVVKIDKSELVTPWDASLETFNWDERWTSTAVEIDGKRVVALYTDGYRPYARELSTSFAFEPNGESLIVKYVVQRYQDYQNKLTDLYSFVWHSRFAETGYEGNALHGRELTETQETDILNLFAKIGGIATEGFAAS